MSFLKPALIAIALSCAAGGAHAGLTVCNQTNWTQSVSIGYKSGSYWVSEGWWNVQPGDCSDVVQGDLENRYYYYRAEIDGGDFDGEGYWFCTTSKAYTIQGDTGCRDRGYDREDFSEIDTGTQARHYTLTLIP